MRAWFFSLLIIAGVLGSTPAKLTPREVLDPDCSDGSWSLIKTEENSLRGVIWGTTRAYVKLAPPTMLGCITVSLLWDKERPVYQTLGTATKQQQSLRVNSEWTPPIRGSKVQYTLALDARNQVISITFALYDGEESDVQVLTRVYKNPLLSSPPKAISEPFQH